MRRGIATVFGDTDVPEAVRRQADTCGAPLLLPSRDFEFQIGEGQVWSWRGASGELRGLQPPGLTGEVQLSNAAAVLALLDVAGLAEAINVELINSVLPMLSRENLRSVPSDITTNPPFHIRTDHKVVDHRGEYVAEQNRKHDAFGKRRVNDADDKSHEADQQPVNPAPRICLTG